MSQKERVFNLSMQSSWPAPHPNLLPRATSHSRPVDSGGEKRQKIAALIVACLFMLNGASSAHAEETETSRKLLTTFMEEFVQITPGQGNFPATVTIGALDGSDAEKPPYQAKIKNEFSIAKYEVYQNLYTEIMGSNPSRWHGPRNSAERMTYSEAEEFCRRITNRLRKDNLITASQLIRLPTEVEWEYCTRAGTTTPYSFGKSATTTTDQGNKASILDPYGWHTGNAAGNDPAVGVLKPNPWGLYDVHGYLSEFCQGPWKSNYTRESNIDKTQVVIRGGSWKDRYPLLTSSSRRPFPKTDRDDAVGFRCVLVKE